MDNQSLSKLEINFHSCPYNIITNFQEHEIVAANETIPANLAVPLYGFAFPVLVLVTTVANTLIVAVLGQSHMRTPTNVLLIAISMSDLFTLIVPAPIFFYMYTLGHHARPIFPISRCYAWYFLYDVIPNTFHTNSIWLTLVLGIQRYIYVCHPPMARLYCNVPRIIKVIFFIFFAAVLHQLGRFFESSYTEACVIWSSEMVPACIAQPSQWLASNKDAYDAYFGLYFWFRVFFVHLGPCTILVALNVLLFKALYRAECKRKILLRENRKSESFKMRDSNCTTMMLIVVLTVFLVTEIPLAVITLLHIFNHLGYIELQYDEYFQIKRFFVISNVFISMSYPINFAIYCGMSRQFLETFRDTFCRNPRLCRRRVSKIQLPTSFRSSTTALSSRRRTASSRKSFGMEEGGEAGTSGFNESEVSKEFPEKTLLFRTLENQTCERSVSFALNEIGCVNNEVNKDDDPGDDEKVHFVETVI